ncbi:uncharacterized protein [Littorina saxatilis]|uniref:THAP-type domain-containing protein n=1 Tax=Littorina saxatilis TaxID=31220 RepID=A0AAN9AY53_9CAEN
MAELEQVILRPSSSRANQHCCVPLCTSTRSKSDENNRISFHKFPGATDVQRRKDWLVKIRRDSGPAFKVLQHTVVCSLHFRPDDFKWTPVVRSLKPDAVPSIFPWTMPTPTRKPPTKRAVLSPQKPGNKKQKAAASEGLPTGQEQEVNPKESGPSSSLILASEKPEEDTFNTDSLLARIKELEGQLHGEQEKVAVMRLERFGVERFSADDNTFEHYTGLPNYRTFQILFDFLSPSAGTMRQPYYTYVSCDPMKSQQSRALPLADELFMFLCRVRQGFTETDLGVRFNISQSTASRKCIAWANFLYFALGSMSIWPSRQLVDQHMPQCFKDKYPSTRVILDCTEIKCQTPSSLKLNSQIYSNYKSASTLKGLVGIAPNGPITFISPLMTGSCSDVQIVQDSGLLPLLDEGDSVMADKGFLIAEVLRKQKVGLNIPPFRYNNGQFSPVEIDSSVSISRLRVHVERAIRRVKVNRIFQLTVPLKSVGSINQVWTVACLLSNLCDPLVSSFALNTN